jgi:2-methylcitrate dehydratase PrpD
MSKVFPREWPSRVVVRFADGRTDEAAVRYPTGEPEAPMTRAQREKKFIDLATQVVTEMTAARIIEEVEGLDRASDVSRLMSLVQAR